MFFSENNREFYISYLDDTFNDCNSIGIPFSGENSIFDLFSPTSLNENSIFSYPRDFPNIPNSSANSNKVSIPLNKYDNNINTLNNIKNKKILKNEEESNYKIDNLPFHYTFDKINNIIQSLDLPSEVKKGFIMDSNLNKIDKVMSNNSFLTKKKRRKKGKIKFTENIETQKIGRKKQDDYSRRKHDRNSADNIIKKIKLKFIEYSLKFLNKVLNSYLDKSKLREYNQILRQCRKYKDDEDKENLLKILDYKFIDKIKKDTDLSLLFMPLKELFSKNISPKYSTLPSDSNKKIIEKIVKEEKDNVNIIFALNLTFEEWIDIFTYKKKLNSIQNFDEEKMKGLNDKFYMVDHLIKEMYDKQYDHNYLSYFLSYVYNYKRWFILKKGRNRISNKIKHN